jgi:hypothetical protein
LAPQKLLGGIIGGGNNELHLALEPILDADFLHHI